jgi:hypothetical protein
LEEQIEPIVQNGPTEVDASYHQKQEQQYFQQDMMNHHRMLMKHHVDLMEHHARVQELYSNLTATPRSTHGYDHALHEYLQA